MPMKSCVVLLSSLLATPALSCPTSGDLFAGILAKYEDGARAIFFQSSPTVVTSLNQNVNGLYSVSTYIHGLYTSVDYDSEIIKTPGEHAENNEPAVIWGEYFDIDESEIPKPRENMEWTTQLTSNDGFDDYRVEVSYKTGERETINISGCELSAMRFLKTSKGVGDDEEYVTPDWTFGAYFPDLRISFAFATVTDLNDFKPDELEWPISLQALSEAY